MSVSEVSQQTLTRLPKIKLGIILRKTRQQIGNECGVSEKTIRRDIQTWVKTDDFLKWLRELWLDEYQNVSRKEAFRQLTKLIARTFETKIRAEIEERFEFVQVDVTEDEDEILSKAAAILARKDRHLPIH